MSEARILAVDTCFGACSAAVVEDGRVLAGRHEVMERGHAEALAPMVEAVMKSAGLGFADLDKLAVTTGPGTFTGQRVGLAFMRALRLALGKPLVGITSLAAMAEQARHQAGTATAAAVHDAKRGEVYLETAGHPAQLMTLAEAEALLTPGIALAGTAAPLFTKLDVRILDILAPDAVWVARLAADLEATSAPRPLYLRAPDAKLPSKTALRMRLLVDASGARALASIHARCFTQVWTTESIAALLGTPGTFAVAAQDDVGFILMRVAGDESEVLTLGVTPAARRRGVATALVVEGIKHAAGQGAKQVFLEVNTTNLPAIALYKRLGFAEVGRRPNYYVGAAGQCDDAIVLRVEIPLLRVGIPMQLG